MSCSPILNNVWQIFMKTPVSKNNFGGLQIPILLLLGNFHFTFKSFCKIVTSNCSSFFIAAEKVLFCFALQFY